MSITLDPHQLGRLIERTAAHIADESIPRLHGIRLEADDTFLYAVASDRYTLAASRYRHDGLNGDEPFARTLPARALPLLRQRTADHKGSDPVTLTEDRIHLVTEHSELLLTAEERDFFGWRGVLRGVIDQLPAGAEDPFPVLDTRLLARWTTAGPYIRARVTADRQAVLVAGEDSLGAQIRIRSRHDGFDTRLADDFEHTRALWDAALADAPAAVMPDSLPTAHHHSCAGPHTVAGTVEGLLRQTMASNRRLAEDPNTSAAAVAAYASADRIRQLVDQYPDARDTKGCPANGSGAALEHVVD
ncbi:hypothetical protein [Streptomyces cinereoruber]|uniref:hypothetical protein n=1 Tax=Streptomyces cinereoruber TaxID=67260 RepID=UPI003C2FF792